MPLGLEVLTGGTLNHQETYEFTLSVYGIERMFYMNQNNMNVE